MHYAHLQRLLNNIPEVADYGTGNIKNFPKSAKSALKNYCFGFMKGLTALV